MGKTFKKIVAAATAALTVGVFSIGAAAAMPDGVMGFAEFNDYSLSDKGGSRTTDPVEKTDTLDYCVVYIESGSVSSYSPVYLSVYTKSGTLAAPGASTSEFERVQMDYYSGMGVFGNYYKLRLGAGYSGLTVSGRWAP